MTTSPASPGDQASAAAEPPFHEGGPAARKFAVVGLGLLPLALLIAHLTQGVRQMERDTCTGAGCHYGLIDYEQWAVPLFSASAALGLIALILPAGKARYWPVRFTALMLQWVLLACPTLICGYP